MLLRLSRVSFWFAAAVAALALLAPAGHETLLTAITLAACAAAYGLWRSGLAAQRRELGAISALPEPPPPLSENALIDAAATLVRRAHEATRFDAALHAVAQVLRSELGARAVLVHEVREVAVDHALVAELIESQPEFHAVARHVRLDQQPLARAITTRREAGEPPGSVVVPVLAEGGVVAAIELAGIALRIAPCALAGLLELARLTLSNRAPDRAAVAAAAVVPQAPAPPRLRGDVLVVEDNVVNPELTTRLLRRMGCRVTPASGMLDARKALSRTQFDLVLVDLQLAGVGALRGIDSPRLGPDGRQGFAAAGAPPMIAIVAACQPADAQRLREQGFDDHVCKPYRQPQMLALLSKYLRPRAPAETAQSGGGAPRQTAAAASGDAVLDPVALARLTELDPTGANHLVERVLKAFQASAARLRPQADAARSGGDPAGLRLVAHTLKSSSASIGALRLSQVCAQIEASIRNGDGADVGAQIDALDAALNEVLRTIDQLLKERT